MLISIRQKSHISRALKVKSTAGGYTQIDSLVME